MTRSSPPATSARRPASGSLSEFCEQCGVQLPPDVRVVVETPVSTNNLLIEQVQMGIMGGSGLYDMAEVTDRGHVTFASPLGDPSGPYVSGSLRGSRVACLDRDGAGPPLSP